jgi:hypothetical protein
MLKGILAYKVASIAVCQLDSAKLCRLFWHSIQFEFSRNHRFHISIVQYIHRLVKKRKNDDRALAFTRLLPTKSELGGYLDRDEKDVFAVNAKAPK